MALINQRLTDKANEGNLHAPPQAGFRAHHTTTEQAFIIQTLIQHSVKAKKALGMVFVDLKRAYVSINKEKLRAALESELNIPIDLI